MARTARAPPRFRNSQWHVRDPQRGRRCRCLCCQTPQALDFSFTPPLAGEEVKGVLNTTFTAGVGVRMQAPASALIAKGNLDPNVCQNPPYQSCQGLFRTQTFMAQHLADVPGS